MTRVHRHHVHSTEGPTIAAGMQSHHSARPGSTSQSHQAGTGLLRTPVPRAAPCTSALPANSVQRILERRAWSRSRQGLVSAPGPADVIRERHREACWRHQKGDGGGQAQREGSLLTSAQGETPRASGGAGSPNLVVTTAPVRLRICGISDFTKPPQKGGGREEPATKGRAKLGWFHGEI